jgi:hypothetical protein
MVFSALDRLLGLGHVQEWTYPDTSANALPETSEKLIPLSGLI